MRENTKLKIMVTGRNRKLAGDVSAHLETDRGYPVVRCAASKTALFDQVPVEMPQIIIICLGDETKDTVRVYDVLRECAGSEWLSVIILAGEEDSRLFVNYTQLKRMYFLSRPVSLMALYYKIADIEEKYVAALEKGMSMVTEYVNPNVDSAPKYRRKHILVVDDDWEQLLQIKEQLSEFYNVTAVRSGRAAFQYLAKHTVDLILLDYIMPEMDGPQVLDQLRRTPEHAMIPVIFVTGVTEKEKIVKTLFELKPQGYIVKPARKSDVVAKIIDVLG